MVCMWRDKLNFNIYLDRDNYTKKESNEYHDTSFTFKHMQRKKQLHNKSTTGRVPVLGCSQVKTHADNDDEYHGADAAVIIIPRGFFFSKKKS